MDLANRRTILDALLADGSSGRETMDLYVQALEETHRLIFSVISVLPDSIFHFNGLDFSLP